MAARPFTPSLYEPTKRANQYNVRFTDAEKALLEREAEKRGVTAPNLVRMLVADGLRRAKSPRSRR